VRGLAVLALAPAGEIVGGAAGEIVHGLDAVLAKRDQHRRGDAGHLLELVVDAKRQELGVEDALKEVPGITTAMLVTLGEEGIKTVEDLAGCATDDLAGWSERKDGETTRNPGILDGFELSREEIEALIMQARVKAGWIKEEDLAPPPAAEPAPVEASEAPA